MNLPLVKLTLLFLFWVPLGVPTVQAGPLRRRLNALLRRNRIPGRKSVYAKWLRGKTIYSRNGRLPMEPASCIKLLSTATALRWMGKNYRFTTTFSGRQEGHTLTTPLYWWSNGDPSFSLNDLVKGVYRLKALGIRSIPKGVVIDSTHFTLKRPRGFQNFRGSHSYLIRPAAVAVEGNGVTVEITQEGGQLKVQCVPASPFIKCTNTAKLGPQTKGLFAYAQMKKRGTLEIFLKGRVKRGAKKLTRRVRTYNPTLFTAGVLIQTLRAAGITVPTKYRRGKRPAGLTTLYKAHSERLATLVQKTNWHSNNFWAENINRALGAFRHGTPGTTTKGLREVYALLQRSGIRRTAFNISNGSGLYGRSRIAARHLVRFMERLQTIPWLHKVMFNSLARPGHSGTLAKRFKGHQGAYNYLYAKTGTLSSASCLAGYLVKGRKTILFAVMNDRIKGNIRTARKFQEVVVKSLLKLLQGHRIKTTPPRL